MVDLRVSEAPDIDVSELPSVDVLIYPIAVEGEIGVYSEAVLTLGKRLRAAGVSAQYVHDRDHRTWLGLNGSELLSSIIVGIFTSGGVAAVQSYLTQSVSQKRIKVKAGRKTEADGSSVEWFEGEGTPKDIVEAMKVVFEDEP